MIATRLYTRRLRQASQQGRLVLRSSFCYEQQTKDLMRGLMCRLKGLAPDFLLVYQCIEAAGNTGTMSISVQQFWQACTFPRVPCTESSNQYNMLL